MEEPENKNKRIPTVSFTESILSFPSLLLASSPIAIPNPTSIGEISPNSGSSPEDLQLKNDWSLSVHACIPNGIPIGSSPRTYSYSLPRYSAYSPKKNVAYSKSWHHEAHIGSPSDRRSSIIDNHNSITVQDSRIDPTVIHYQNPPISHTPNNSTTSPFIRYDPITNARGSGIIPYTILNNEVYFLFQVADNPLRFKDAGLNDFGGKRNDGETDNIKVACREFCEETSCLFYLKENPNTSLYDSFRDNTELFYPPETVDKLRNLIPIASEFFEKRIKQVVHPLYLSSKEIYVTFMLRVEYIPEGDLPRAEDIHIDYEDRYTRRCKWVTYDELMNTAEESFHKRLQITKIKQRITNYVQRSMF